MRTQKNVLLQVEGGLGEVGGAAEVAPIVVVGAEGEDFFALGREAEVGRDDGEDAFFGEHGKEARGNDVDAGEGEGVQRNRREISRFARNDSIFVVDAAAAELEVLVEEEGAGGFAGLDGKGGEGAIFLVELQHAAEIDVADDVDVVEEEGLVELFGITAAGIATFRIGASGIFEEKPGGLFQAAAGVQQNIFAGNFNAHAGVVVGFEIVDDPIGEVMDVDDHFGDGEGAQAGKGDFEEGAAGEFDKGFGAIIGKRAKARAQAGGEDHGFHCVARLRRWRVASFGKEG